MSSNLGRWRTLALVLPLTLVAVACGSGEDVASDVKTTVTTAKKKAATTTSTTVAEVTASTETTLAVAAAARATTPTTVRAAVPKQSTQQQPSAPASTLPPRPELEGSITADGSSTVGPLTEAGAELFQKEYPKVRITVGISGTGGGFKKFCNGEIDIQDASRAINQTEIAACASKGLKYDAFQVANDALTVVVNKSATWVDCLTTAQLKKIWDTGSKVANWNEIDPSFPNEPLKLFGPGTASGTFDYFTEEINGKAKQSRSDYLASEDDNVLVQGVSGSKGGMGYFGFSYYEENESKLKALQINSGAGCVPPSVQTVQNGTYKPLGRPLFVYVTSAALKKLHTRSFIEYYLLNTDPICKKAHFIGLTAAQKQKALDQYKALAAQD